MKTCMPVVLFGWSVFLAPGSIAAFAQEATSGILFTGARVFDASTGRLVDGLDVLVEKDRITKVAAAGTIAASSAAMKIQLSGLTLLPGLIDLHSHLLLHPYSEASWNDQVLRESLELRTIRAVPALQVTLESGFTTLRDLGTEGAGFADVALRDAVNKGIVPGPRIFAVSKALVATGCYGPSGFDPRWEVPIGAQVADGVDGVRRAVREQIAAGADWIKVYADYSRRSGDPASPTFSQQELNAIADEAQSAGLLVAAHATIDEAIRRAVLAGVATIEHGYLGSAEIFALMKERSVVLCPTLAASEAMSRYDGWKPGTPDHPRIEEAKAMFRRALQSGVTIGCGSDVGVFAHGESARELELMVDYGMSAGEAIKAATSSAARVLRRERDLGQVAEGFLADLVVVRGNPLEHIGAIRETVMVVKEGRIVLDRRE